MKAIYFDMDGTIANLYGYKNWLEMLQAEDVTPYADCEPLVNMEELDSILNAFVKLGVTIGIISWGAMNGSAAYTRATKKAKIAWCEKYLTCITEYHVVKYGTAKHNAANIKDSILVDDNAEVREAWKNGATIDASNSEKMIEELRQLLHILEVGRKKRAESGKLTKEESAQEEGLFSSLWENNYSTSNGLYMIGQTTFNPITQEKRYWVKVGMTTRPESRIDSYLTHSADIYFIDWRKTFGKRGLRALEHSYHTKLEACAISRRTEWFKVSEKFYLEICEKGFAYFN